MDSRRWAEIERHYHAALEIGVLRRQAYLDAACGADGDLRREIEELLGFAERAEHFIERPAIETLAQVEADALRFRLEAGAQLGPYQILEPLAAGGMGEVYRAKDTRLGRVVALKILAAAMNGAQGFHEQTEREGSAVSRLNHPGICALYDIGRENGIDYLVMEFVQGETLAARLERAPVAFEEQLRISIEIAEALDYAHRHGVIHRDLKPGNIMLASRDGGGVAKLVDFGIARQREPSDDAASPDAAPRLGTPQYMAPEQIAGGEVDARADIFSLGAVMFEMAYRRKAFDSTGPGRHAVAGREAGVPDAFRKIVLRCLADSPADRWPSAGAVAVELRRIVPGPSPRLRWAVSATIACTIAAAFFLARAHRLARPSIEILDSFTGESAPLDSRYGSGVIADLSGNIYGIAPRGGAFQNGYIFELKPGAAGKGWTKEVLHEFRGVDGARPAGSLAWGPDGSLYGVTEAGGRAGLGSAFRLTRSPGGAWTETVLHHFGGIAQSDGKSPRAALSFDAQGAAYGTTLYGGRGKEDGFGVVFKLAPAESGEWRETVLYRFTDLGDDGAYPFSGVVFGDDGSLYGTAYASAPFGIAYKLTPAKVGEWTETVLHRFGIENGDGRSPVGGLAPGENGEFYGTAQSGGTCGKRNRVCTDSTVERADAMEGSGAVPLRQPDRRRDRTGFGTLARPGRETVRHDHARRSVGRGFDLQTRTPARRLEGNRAQQFHRPAR